VKCLSEVLGKCKKCGTIANWKYCHNCSFSQEGAELSLAEYNNEKQPGVTDGNEEETSESRPANALA